MQQYRFWELLINNLYHVDRLFSRDLRPMCLSSSFSSVMRRNDRRKNYMRRSLTSPTTTQNGGEKSIEYCQLKAATLAGEFQKVFVAAVFAFHTGKPVVDLAAIQIPINHLLDVRSPESVLSSVPDGVKTNPATIRKISLWPWNKAPPPQGQGLNPSGFSTSCLPGANKRRRLSSVYPQ
jgi:hypothetical protein